jgi:hypothetical protein
MFMGAGAKIVGMLFGTAGVVALFVTAGTLGFQRWEMHKAGLRGEGRMMCTVEFERAARLSERVKADEERDRAIEVARVSEETVDQLRGDYDNLSNEYAALRAAVDAQPATDPARCLSDGVLGKFRGNRKVEGAGSSAGSGKPGS